ncbi:unnamed protein product [Clonostachys chloroleuca]|uniref:Uncharacterized protein n=1 Tax=Clonostachys chloroleuca TaxID=1926264 RepID=A0AA35M0B2_9HYPO|nr:unnamed protein product [Clonostachys chloroleuca]
MSKYGEVNYHMFDITKSSGFDETKSSVDQFGFADEGAKLVIKSAENKADKTINGKKASLAELLLASYKYNSVQKVDPAKLQVIRIQHIKEGDTANRMREVEKAMNPELQNPEKKIVNPQRKEGMSEAAWIKKKKEERDRANRNAKKNAKSRPRPPRITKFDLSDTSNPKLYQDMKDSVWGQSVERISRRFNGKRIVRIHVDMADEQSFLIFYLG